MLAICKQMQIQPALHMPSWSPWRQRDKVVVVIGATGTGKSRLSVDLATMFRPAEIINSDKMQVYEGLDVVTNKITAEEQRGVPHHLLGTVKDPNADFTAADFAREASLAVDAVVGQDKLPIIAGGSNSFVERLVEDRGRDRQWCFLWVDVSMPVLHSHVSERVDEMVRNGMVEEARTIFDPEASYSRGIRRAIGVPEFDRYFAEGTGSSRALREALQQVKDNTCKLACRQVGKIHRLRMGKGWCLHRLDATEVYRHRLRRGCKAEAEEAWCRHVAGPAAAVVRRFLCDFGVDFQPRPSTVAAGLRAPAAMREVLAAAVYR